MKLPVIYWYINKGILFRFFHIHTGFNDYSLLWIVDGKIIDLLFIRIN